MKPLFEVDLGLNEVHKMHILGQRNCSKTKLTKIMMEENVNPPPQKKIIWDTVSGIIFFELDNLCVLCVISKRY